jgi:hypothetical protein
MQNIKNKIKFFAILFIISIPFIFSGVVEAANLYFAPSSGSYSMGRSFTVSVYVSSTSQLMNAVSGIITFPSDKLQVNSLSKTGSIISFWVQEPSFSNITGTINLEGVVLPSGYIGSNGKILDINFVAKSQGTASLNFSSGSVLAHDGQGTNILDGLGNASYNITGVTTTKAPPTTQTTISKTPKAVKIYSETHPDPNKWYSEDTAIFNWKLTNDITEVRLLINRDPDAKPTISYSPPVNSKTVTNLGKGVWYFYVQLKNQYGWGEVSRFRLQIDSSVMDEVDVSLTETTEIEEIETIEEGKQEIERKTRFAFLGNFALAHLDFFIIIFIITLIGFIILSGVFWLHYWKVKYSQKKLKEEAERTELILYRAFDNLRKEVTKEIAKLDGNDLLSEREKEIDEKLKEAIRNSEKLIDEKIKHIKKEINGD